MEKMEKSPESKYPEWAKIPANYDFSTFGKNWSQFHKYFKLRTDAVWEKSKLLQYFHSFYKPGFFDAIEKRYYYVRPMTSASVTDLKFFHDMKEPWTGWTATGATNAFETLGGRKRKQYVSEQVNYMHQDYFELCAVRFDRFSTCDLMFSDKRIDFAKRGEEYPCYKYFYEAQFSCSDDMILFLMEAHFYRQMHNLDPKKFLNNELDTPPSVFDSIDVTSRAKLSY